MRVTTAFNRLLGLKGISVLEVSFGDASSVTVDVALRRRRLVCPLCSFSSAARYDTLPVTSSWRHLDFGRWQVLVRARLRRLTCPEHGVRVEAVPFARARSGFTRDFEDLVAFLATKTDKTTITRLSRVDWDTVGRICQRVVAHGLDPDRLDGLVTIGVDEVSWRRHHNYLTLVADHTSKKIVSRFTRAPMSASVRLKSVRPRVERAGGPGSAPRAELPNAAAVAAKAAASSSAEPSEPAECGSVGQAPRWSWRCSWDGSLLHG